MQILFNIFPRISLHCKLVPVQYWEYEYGLLGRFGETSVNHDFKTRKWLCGILLLITLWLQHKQDDSEKKRLLSRQFAINLKNRGLTFFKITQMQFVSILSISAHPCLSFLLLFFCFMLFNSFVWLLQCAILLFGQFGYHKITSFCAT